MIHLAAAFKDVVPAPFLIISSTFDTFDSHHTPHTTHHILHGGEWFLDWTGGGIVEQESHEEYIACIPWRDVMIEHSAGTSKHHIFISSTLHASHVEMSLWKNADFALDWFHMVE
jgi:hypothetical protein